VTRVLLWKEVREQWVIWLALVLGASGLTVAASVWLDSNPFGYEVWGGSLVVTAWIYGLVCGSQLLAGETEGKTQTFLDTLPGTRRRLWRAKACVGLVLWVALVAALAVVGLLLFRGSAEAIPVLLGALAAAAFVGGTGYACGLYCGSFAKTVLGAAGRAILTQVTISFFLGMTAGVLDLFKLRSALKEEVVITTFLGLAAVAVALRSRAIYSLPDRLRRSPPRPLPEASASPVGLAGSFRHELYEARWFIPGMALLGLVGMVVLASRGTAAWPVLSLVLGVVCGLTVFAGERGWLPRAVIRFAIGVAAALVMALAFPLLGRTHTEPEAAPHVEPFAGRVQVSAVSALATNPGVFETFGLVNGFACGLLAGLLFRERLLAAAAGTGLAALFGGIWLPTLYTGGGLQAWHLFAVPAIFSVVVIPLAYARTAGRLTTLWPVSLAVGALLGAGLVTVGALWYRATEMPPDPNPVDPEAFAASLPKPGENRAGRLTVDVLVWLDALRGVPLFFDDDGRPQVLPPDKAAPAGKAYADFIRQTVRVTARGWLDDPDLATFLDRAFEEPQMRDLADIAGRPTGLVEDPREQTLRTPQRDLTSGRDAALLLVARGLQQQHGGDPAAFVGHLGTGLALARNLRLGSLGLESVGGTSVELVMTIGVARWLEHLDGRPDLLRQALTVLLAHNDSPRSDPEVKRKTRLLILLNTFADPSELPRAGDGADPFFAAAPSDRALLQFAWSAPWEQVRLRRLLDGIASNDPDARYRVRQLVPPVAAIPLGRFNAQDLYLERSRPVRPLFGRVAALQVALRLFEAEQGRPADKLDELVPKYLPAIPADPYDGKPFRYRLSKGETLDWPPDDYDYRAGGPYEHRSVPAGQGILWSVGFDGRDDGGRVQEWPDPAAKSGSDVLYLVPRPPGRP
jgi:hypothetical protein